MGDSVASELAVPIAARVPAASPRVGERSPRFAMRTTWWVAFVVLAAAGFFATNGLITSAAVLELPVLIMLLWRPGEPPTMLFACWFQWLQATAAIFYTNHLGITLEEAFGSYALNMAAWLSMAAVLVLAIATRCGFIGAQKSEGDQIEAEARQLDVNKIGPAYVVSLVLSIALTIAGAVLGPIRQPLLAFAALKWAFVFLLCYTVLTQRKGFGWLAFCIAVEFVLGFWGIYAGFKWVFFVLVIACLSSRRLMRGGRIALITVIFVLLFIMGIVWNAIKTDYRSFLAEEEEEVPIERRFSKLADLVESLNFENIGDGLDALIMRVSYVNFFALTIENVPSRLPYENGELWKGAVVHALMPRVLFPDKAILDDSDRTRLYTGMNVAGAEQSTSIGIGYVGESYIDFGPIGMFVPIFLLGLMYGVISRFFIKRTRYKLLGSSIALSLLVFNAYEIETSNIKLFGGVVAATIGAIIFYKLCAPNLMQALRRGPPVSGVAHGPAKAGDIGAVSTGHS